MYMLMPQLHHKQKFVFQPTLAGVVFAALLFAAELLPAAVGVLLVLLAPVCVTMHTVNV